MFSKKLPLLIFFGVTVFANVHAAGIDEEAEKKAWRDDESSNLDCLFLVRDVNKTKDDLEGLVRGVLTKDGLARAKNFLKDYDFNARDENGWTVLMYAALHGCVSLTKYLVDECGAKIGRANHEGFTAAIIAAQHGHEEIIECLLESANVTDSERLSALFGAVGSGRTELVKFFAKKPWFDVNVQDRTGASSVIFAAAGGHGDTVKCLVGECKADVNIRDSRGRTALMKATSGGRLDIVKCLVEGSNVDVNAQDNDGFTASMIARCQGYENVVNYLAGRGYS